MAVHQLPDLKLIFFRPDATGAIDQKTAVSKPGEGVVEDIPLKFQEAIEAGGVSGLGPTGENAAVAAWDVDEDTIE